MSPTTIVLHIGLHKTGTSSIQETLRQNRDALQARGVVYPRALPANHSNFFYNAFGAAPETYHANRAHGLTREAIAERTAPTLEALRKEVAAHAGRTIVFSGEDACTLDAAATARAHAFFASLVPGARLEVLLYTRHPVDYIASAVQENVKGNGLTIARAKAIHMGAAPDRYQKIHKTYGDVFGEAAVRLRSFEAGREAAGGLIGDFMAALGVSAEGIVAVRRNESIAGELVPFLSERNAMAEPFALPPQDAARLFALKGGSTDVLDAAEKMRLWQFVAGDIHFLSRRFGIRYEREVAPGPSVAAERRARFVREAAAALPDLSAPVRAAFEDYLVRAGLRESAA